MMPTRAIDRVPYWSVIASVLALSIAAGLNVLPRAATFPVLVLAVLVGAARIWRQLDRAQRSLLAGLLVFSGMIAVLPPWLNQHSLPIQLVTGRLATVCTGWTIVLWLPLATDERYAELKWQPRAWHVLLLLAITLAIAATKHALMVGRFAVLQDEVLYLLQSDWMDSPRFGWRIDPALLQFFRPEYTAYRNGVLTTQYPPGWPALLAMFSALGLRWWSTSILAVATVWFTYLLGRRLHSPALGFVAAALLALQRWLVESAHGYMSQGASLAAVSAAAYLLIRGEGSSSTRQRVVAWLLSGFALGLSIAVRPLSGVALSVSLLAWLLLRGRLSGVARAALLPCVVLGALLPVIGLLYYNNVTNGSPLVLGYQAVHGKYHDLGFGARGYRYFAGSATPVAIATKPFTVVNAVTNFGQRVWDFSAAALPLFLLLPLGFAVAIRRFRFHWPGIAAFLVLPAAYFFYFFTNIRFYAELLPFLTIGVAAMLVYLIRHEPAAARVLLPILVIASLSAALTTASGEHTLARRAVFQSASQIKQVAGREGKIVVFLYDPSWEAYLFRRLSFFNQDGLNGDIIIARDRGAANAMLMRRLPTHHAWRGQWDSAAGRLRLTPLPKLSAN